MLAALALSFGVIFVAELGDKSQLMAMTFATRYRWWVVLIGILSATTAVHVVSVFVGHFLGLSIPHDLMSIIAGISMLVFAFWTLRGDKLDDAEKVKANLGTRSAFLAVTSAFFLAELGDKTMLATIALSTNHNWFGVWVGSTIGMVTADALAIIIGAMIGQRLPERAIALGAAALFFAFSIWLLYEGLKTASIVTVILTILAIVCVSIAGSVVVLNERRPIRQRAQIKQGSSRKRAASPPTDSRTIVH